MVRIDVEKSNEILDLLKQVGDVYGSKILELSKIDKIAKNHLDQTCVTFSLKTQDWMRNTHNIVHGGCTATLVDYLTTYAAIGDERYWIPDEDGEAPDQGTVLKRLIDEFGLSRHISVQYQRAIPVGSTIYVDCILESSTRRFIYITCKIHDGKGRIYATGAHDKVKEINTPKL